MTERAGTRDAHPLRTWAPLIVLTTLLAASAIRAILAKTGGEPAVPLDDSYIHFQFARSFARLQPFVYSPGAPATPGATSLLWPLVLSPFWAIGLRGTSLIWPAWLLGFASLGLLARETLLLGTRLVSRESALAAAGMVLVFGGLVWCAGSGMEVVPFSFLLVRSARLAADWRDRSGEPGRRRERLSLVATAVLVVLARPEGALGALAIAVALTVWPRGGRRAWALVALAALALPPTLNWIFTGQAASTTAVAKWLPGSPYYRGSHLLDAVLANVKLVFDTLLDGRVWSAEFLPAGSRYAAWACLPALLFVTWRRRVTFRGGLVLVVALGMLLPASYECMLCNRLRYLWPFAPGWFIALGALADAVGLGLTRLREELAISRVLVAGAFVGALASHLSPSIDDLAASADAIRRQQTSLGRWAKDALPAEACIGVNDTGAIAYFSDRRVFDVVGLTTKGESRYWVAGAGSRFEHYERMTKSELPTHFIVYPEWMAISEVMGQELTERTVNATILGGTTMIAYQADYALLGSGDDPLLKPGTSRVDELDVADLESEAAHDYQLLDAAQADNRVFADDRGGNDRADGGRRRRSVERFGLQVANRGEIVVRLLAEEPTEVELRIDRQDVGVLSLSGLGSFEEPRVSLPPDMGPGIRQIELKARSGKTFAALHYWSFAGKSP
jgi:hypothetical protein